MESDKFTTPYQAVAGAPALQWTFGEAFMLMWYHCEGCGHRERIWNSRDGVTPFAMGCPSCGQPKLRHANWGNDVRAAEHQLHHGQGFWRDGTLEDAVAIINARLDSIQPDSPYYPTPERRQAVLDELHSGRSLEFRPGWPMFERFDATKPQPKES